MAPFRLHQQLSGRIICAVPRFRGCALQPHLHTCPSDEWVVLSDRSRRWWRFAHYDAYPVASFCCQRNANALPLGCSLDYFEPYPPLSPPSVPSAFDPEVILPEVENPVLKIWLGLTLKPYWEVGKSFISSFEGMRWYFAGLDRSYWPSSTSSRSSAHEEPGGGVDLSTSPRINWIFNDLQLFTRELISPRAFVFARLGDLSNP